MLKKLLRTITPIKRQFFSQNPDFTSSSDLSSFTKKGFTMKKKNLHLSASEIKQKIKNLEIPKNELNLSYACSQGPGGQHVNKTASKAILKFNIENSKILSNLEKNEIMKNYGNRVNKNGDLVLSFQKFREQSKNENEVISILKKIIAECTVEEIEQKVEIQKENFFKKENRVKNKRRRSDVKKLRGKKFDY